MKPTNPKPAPITWKLVTGPSGRVEVVGEHPADFPPRPWMLELDKKTEQRGAK